ncbi:MAG: PQQ-binding-like beta-propeller repeat protein [Deltaproteobacteria bacterium]|nr:PQQ-binding-like beta-propeller repeat protein [Candidatus Zymogenaceae bacterium]
MRNVCKYKIPYVISFALLLIAILLTGCERTNPVSIKWTYDTGYHFTHYFEVVDDVIYTSYADGNLYAVDKHNGKLKWEYYDEERGFADCSVVDDVVYLVRFGCLSRDRSEMNYLYAFDSTNGELMWRYNLGGNEVVYYETKPIIAHNIIYIAGPQCNLYAIDAERHELLWRFNAKYFDIRSISSVTDGMVYFYTDKYFYAVDAATGDLVFQWEAKKCMISSATVADGVAYIPVYDIVSREEISYLYAIDAKSGKLKWRYREDAMGWIYFPHVVDGVIYFGGDNSYVYALDSDTGKLIWKQKIRIRYRGRPHTATTPTVVDDILYVGCKNKRLYAFDADTGKLLWRFKTGGPVCSSIIVEDDVIYFGSFDGYLYALEINSNGQELTDHDE